MHINTWGRKEGSYCKNTVHRSVRCFLEHWRSRVFWQNSPTGLRKVETKNWWNTRTCNLVSYLGGLKLEKWIFFSSPSWFLITKASALTHSITCFQIVQHNRKRFSWVELLHSVQTSCHMNFRLLCISITRCQWCPLDQNLIKLFFYSSIEILVMASVWEALCEVYIRRQRFHFDQCIRQSVLQVR